MSTDLSTARLLARLLMPTREVKELCSLKPERAPALVRACQRNKIPLLSLAVRDPFFTPLLSSEVFQRAREEERQRWAAWRGEYLQVSHIWAQAGIRAVLIKSVGIAPSFPYRSDNIDVLVSLEDAPLAREILLDEGYVELKNVEEPHKFLFRKFHEGTSVSAIHLHEFVGWGTGFLDDKAVLARARRPEDDPDLLIPSAEEGLLITMAHAFYEDKEVKLGDLWKVVHLLREELDWERIFQQAERWGWREGLEASIWLWAELERWLYGEHSFPKEVVARARREVPGWSRRYLDERLSAQPSFPWRIGFFFSKRHYYAKIWRDKTISWGQKALDALRHSWAGVERRLPFRWQRPMLISLSGVDGSGKTSLVQGLRGALQECDLAAEVIWCRGASSPLTDALIRLVKPLLPRRQGLDVQSGSRKAKVIRKSFWLQHPLLRWGWILLTLADAFLTCWPKICWALLRGRIVLADRYIYDVLVELAALVDRVQVAESWPAKLALWLFPQPHIAYLLDVSPEEALARKPEEYLPFLERQVFVYHRLAVPWDMRLVNAEEELVEVQDRLTHEVLISYYAPGEALQDVAEPMEG